MGGAIHFLATSEEPLIITGRTFDERAGGTYGQFIPAVTPADAVGVDDRALEIQQLEQSDRYRTNVGLAEVTGNEVEVELTATVPGTTVAPKMRVTLDPNEFTQLNGVLQQMGLGNAYNARMSVKVVGGGAGSPPTARSSTRRRMTRHTCRGSSSRWAGAPRYGTNIFAPTFVPCSIRKAETKEFSSRDLTPALRCPSSPARRSDDSAS